MAGGNHEPALIGWGATAGIFVFIVTVILVHTYSRRDCPWMVRLATYWCWWCTFSVTYLIPIDLSPSSDQEGSLFLLWTIMYWTSFVLAWTVIPVAWYYVEAGEFTSMGKFCSALKGNIIFYLLAGTLLIGFLIFLAVEGQLSGLSIQGFAICLSNTWGLTVYVLLLGYGLVELPRSTWYMSDINKLLELMYYKAAVTYDLMQRAADDLVTTQKLLGHVNRKAAAKFPSQMMQIKAKMDVLENVDLKMDGNYSDFSETSLYEELDRMDDPELKQLVKLNVHCHSAIRKYFRLHDTMVDTAEQGIYYQNLIRQRDVPMTTICAQGLGGVCAALRLRWMMFYRTTTLRVISVLLSIMSILVIWGQICIKFPSMNPWALAYDLVKTSDAQTNVMMVIPLTYLCTCAFFSMFRLKLFDYYCMDSKRKTEEVSLMFNCTYLVRIFGPIGANFVALVGAEDTAFQRVIGSMTVVPFFGSAFQDYLPILISLFCICTLFDLYARVLKCLDIDQFTYWSTNDPDKLEEGKRLVEQFGSKQRKDEAADNFL